MSSQVSLGRVFFLITMLSAIESCPAQQVAKSPTTRSAAVDELGIANDRFNAAQETSTGIKEAVDYAIAAIPKKNKHSDAWTRKNLFRWITFLEDKNEFDSVEQLSIAVIASNADLLDLVEKAQMARIRAKLAQRKPAEALSLAKSLYNVCAMPSTSEAIDLISQALYDINVGKDPTSVVKRFKLEQIKGAEPPATTQSTSADSAKSPTLIAIKVDGAMYQTMIENLKPSRKMHAFEMDMARGNLLLLADQPGEASKVFQKAYTLASEANLPAATDAVARSIRAMDGTVGRANAWILSLRSTDEPGQADQSAK